MKLYEIITPRKNKNRLAENNKLLDKPTPTVKQLALKHGVDITHIRAELEKGVRVESEHTSDPEIAKEIALDHINELPDYYTRLASVEEGNKAQLGIPANATDAELRKARKAGGKKGQRAHWLLNMRKGNKK